MPSPLFFNKFNISPFLFCILQLNKLSLLAATGASDYRLTAGMRFIVITNHNELIKSKIMIQEILKFNRGFVESRGYERFATSKYPDKKIAIVTCMDTRLVELLPAALGLRNGDVKIIKNAGGTITNPFDSTMRSLLVAVYELGVNEIMVIGHTNCGVQGMNAEEMLDIMRRRGVSEEHIRLMEHCGINLREWLHGFEDTDAAVMETVDLIRNHPLMVADVNVAGYVMDSLTGELRAI